MLEQRILRGTAVRCDSEKTLYVRFGGYEGIIPRSEAVHPSISGSSRDISVLSIVGKEICFTITSIDPDPFGRPKMILSRRLAQEQVINHLLDAVPVGTVLPARVTHLAPFGAFVDVGCGVISMIALADLSVSPVPHPAQRLSVGQDILARLTGKDRDSKRFYLSRKELLGTWQENAALFSPGDTVTGIVRGVREYGIFVELTENLSGLADWRADVLCGDRVTVCIKAIRPDTGRIKLHIIQSLGPAQQPEPGRYYITDGIVTDWHYRESFTLSQ